MYIFTQPGSECWSLWGAHLKCCCKELWDGCSEVSDAGSAGVYILLFLMCRLEALLGTNQTDSTETSVTSRMFILYCCCWVSWNCLYLQFQSSGGSGGKEDVRLLLLPQFGYFFFCDPISFEMVSTFEFRRGQKLHNPFLTVAGVPSWAPHCCGRAEFIYPRLANCTTNRTLENRLEYSAKLSFKLIILPSINGWRCA